jgi:cell division septal protein FtsQ
MTSRKKSKKNTARDWTALRQSSARKPDTRVAWWRRIKLRFHTLAVWSAGTCGFAFLILSVSYFTSNPLDVNLSGPSGRVSRIEFQTNGSLTHEWLVDYLQIPENSRLMDLDLIDLKSQIETVAQVKVVDIQRRYPDVLRIMFTEHVPILKIYIADPEQGKKRLLVSETGEVFEGFGHPELILAELPVLFGGRLLKGSNGFFPLEVVSQIKPLLDAARSYNPKMLRDWSRIRFDVLQDGSELDGLIRVRTAQAREVIFSTEMDYHEQLRRLDYVIDYSVREGWTTLALVDLPGQKSSTVRLISNINAKSNQTLLF